MLAGAGHEAVFYQMQPPFLSDARLVISAIATHWAAFEQSLAQMRPDLVVVQVEIAPGPEALIQVLAEMQVWHGVAILVLPPALRDLRGDIREGQRGARRLHRPGELGGDRPGRLCRGHDRTRPGGCHCSAAAGLSVPHQRRDRGHAGGGVSSRPLAAPGARPLPKAWLTS